MGTLNNVSIYIVQALLHLYLAIMFMRFLLQIVRADFYNPLSQFVVRATQPLVGPLQKILPDFGRFDLSSLLLSILIQIVSLVVVTTIAGSSSSLSLAALSTFGVWSLLSIAGLLLKVYIFALLVRVVVSWVAPTTRHPAVMLVYQITEPVMAPVRNIIPPIGGLDISMIFVFLGINALQIALYDLAAQIQVNPNLLVGI